MCFESDMVLDNLFYLIVDKFCLVGISIGCERCGFEFFRQFMIMFDLARFYSLANGICFFEIFGAGISDLLEQLNQSHLCV